MCGRIVQSDAARYAERLGADLDLGSDWHPSWNLGPTAPIVAVRQRAGERRLQVYSWGLLPGWSRSPASRVRNFNARAETLTTKPTFRTAFERRRLLVPVDGFYEWQAPRQPNFFERSDGDPLVFAGLWEYWEHTGEGIRSATVVTTAAGPDMPIHDRQPVVLEPEAWDRWLDPAADERELSALLVAGPAGTLVHRRVGPDVGNVRNDNPSLIEAVPG